LKFIPKGAILNKLTTNLLKKNMEIIPPTKVKIIEIVGKGRGVVATQKISKGEIIETCPIIEISKKEADFIQNQSHILNYYYLFQEDLERYCLMLGYGSIYNHSHNPNADIDYSSEKTEKYLQFKALRDVEIGEEIVFNYEFENNEPEFLNLD
jgi:hypothetical protein